MEAHELLCINKTQKDQYRDLRSVWFMTIENRNNQVLKNMIQLGLVGILLK